MNLSKQYLLPTAYMAIGSGRTKDLEALLADGLDVNCGNCRYIPLLHHAAYFGYLEYVKRLVEAYHADIHTKDYYQNTPLHGAARQGHLEIVKYLMSLGADAMSRNHLGYTPFQEAAARGHLNVVKLFVKMVGNGFTKIDESTPLHSAAYTGKIQIVEFLIMHKADPNSRNECGDTALHEAIRGHDLDVVKLLIENFNVDVNITTRYGETPLCYARDFKCSDIEEYLISKEAHDSNDKERFSEKRRYSPVINLTEEEDVNTTSKRHRGSVHDYVDYLEKKISDKDDSGN